MNLRDLPALRAGHAWRGCASADAMAPYSRVVLRASIYLPPVDRWVERSDLSFCDAFRVQDNPRASTRGFLFFWWRVLACPELRATSVSASTMGRAHAGTYKRDRCSAPSLGTAD
jgi:hypothetical protein